jgi:hypothetical protein
MTETKNEIKVSLEDILKCDVCRDILYDATTLLCQHSFCSVCLSSLKECPLCRLKIHLPIQNNSSNNNSSNNNSCKINNIFNKISELLHNKEKINELKNRKKRDILEKELHPKVLEELNKSLDRVIVSNQQNQLQNQQNNLNDTLNLNQTSVENFSLNNPTSYILGFKFNISSFFKGIEYAFLLYYIYGFIINTKNNFNWFRFIINLVLIVQSAITIISPIAPISINSIL